MARRKPCKFENCLKTGGDNTGYCADHVISVKRCRVCDTPVSAWSHALLCREHYWMSGKYRTLDRHPLP